MAEQVYQLDDDSIPGYARYVSTTIEEATDVCYTRAELYGMYSHIDGYDLRFPYTCGVVGLNQPCHVLHIEQLSSYISSKLKSAKVVGFDLCDDNASLMDWNHRFKKFGITYSDAKGGFVLYKAPKPTVKSLRTKGILVSVKANLINYITWIYMKDRFGFGIEKLSDNGSDEAKYRIIRFSDALGIEYEQHIKSQVVQWIKARLPEQYQDKIDLVEAEFKEWYDKAFDPVVENEEIG